jgi:membrane protein DedA with SNARE-associated domain
MTEILLNLVEEWGIAAVLLSLFIEGSALPFIGTFFIGSVGFILNVSWFEIAWISVAGGLLYAIGSYIPFYIGSKLGSSIEKRLNPVRRESLEKAKASFSKHGIWSVAISSPLHLGNVIPFLAGMSKMNLRLYTLLTMLGIAPTTFLLLSIGRLYPGDSEGIIEKISEYQSIVLIGFVLITVLYTVLKIRRKKQQHPV